MKDIRKIVLRVWLVIWVLALPLVHIHPEVDHAHGMSSHLHRGTYHSILLKTPVRAHQDHEQHHHDGFFFQGEGFRSAQSPLHPHHGFEEATYDFSILKPSIALESEKSEFSHDLVLTDNVEPLSTLGALRSNFTLAKRHFIILPKTLSPRAPPILSI